LIDMRTNLTKF